jgi:hypothetical protein
VSASGFPRRENKPLSRAARRPGYPEHDGIGKGMVEKLGKNEKQKSGLNKAILDQGLG